MNRVTAGTLVGLGLFACTPKPTPATRAPEPAPTHEALAPVAGFAEIADPTARSVALFAEIGKVLVHPRCSNCHPADDSPRQGLAQVLHDPAITRGPDDHGPPGLECTSCHQDHNQAHTRVPGAPHWALAPIEMAWMDRSLAAICAQLKDPARNGGKDLEALHLHMAEDALVGWAWDPGADRLPAPGTQAELGQLVRAWIDTGAACPEEGP